MPIPSWSRRAHLLPPTPGGALEGGALPTLGLAVELAGTHLGPCFYLGPAVQQEPHHNHVPPAGGDVQRRDAVLVGRNRMVRVRAQPPPPGSTRPAPCAHAPPPPPLPAALCPRPGLPQYRQPVEGHRWDWDVSRLRKV